MLMIIAAILLPIGLVLAASYLISFVRWLAERRRAARNKDNDL